jgi:hypothetical protein
MCACGLFLGKASHGPCRGPIVTEFDVTPVPASVGEAPGSRHPQARSFGASNPKLTPALGATRGERFAADSPGRCRRLVGRREDDLDHRLSICHYVNRFNRISRASGFSCSICVKAVQCLTAPHAGRPGRIDRTICTDTNVS